MTEQCQRGMKMKETYEEHRKIINENRIYCMGKCKRFRKNQGHFRHQYVCTICLKVLAQARNMRNYK